MRPSYDYAAKTTAESIQVGRRFLYAIQRIGMDRAVEVIGLKAPTIKNFIAGRTEPTPEVLERLCKASGVSATWILYGLSGHLPVVQDERPKTRGDCVDGPRPCPWVGCRMHLLLHITPTGRITQHHEEVDEMAESCALDVADRGPHNNDAISSIMRMARTRVDQIVQNGLDKCINSDLEQCR